MKKLNIFEFDNYKAYIRTWSKTQPRGGRGIRSLLASKLKCHTAYISNVLNHSAHFSMEQAEEFNSLACHTKDEAEFFLLLIQIARAGTQSLKKRLEIQLSDLRERQIILKNRVKIDPVLSKENQQTYYSSWLYAAIHILVTIPEFQDHRQMSERLKIPVQRVQTILDFLVSTGLLIEDSGHYKAGKARIFLGSDSPFIAQHHTNWRVKAIESFSRGETTDLHLSTVLSLSKNDVLRVKEKVIQTIQEIRQLAKESKEEELHCFSLDFFEV